LSACRSPDIETLGAAPAALVAAGGLLYTAGAVVYARKRPDPVAAVFGYHEVFHALVIAAAALQYAAIRVLRAARRAGVTGCAARRVRPCRGWRASGRA
jgi:hypothetical protein